MFKKLVLGTLVAVIIVVGGYALLSPKQPSKAPGYCAFCDPAVINAQKFYEDEGVIALYTYKPIFPGHCLIIPKRHVERFEGVFDAEALEMCRVIKKVNAAVVKVFGTSSYLLLQKNGVECGQTVPHVHFHYIPRKAGDDSHLKFFLRMFIANSQKPISPEEIAEVVEQLKQEM